MIVLTLAKDLDEAEREAERITSRLKHRLTESIKKIELELELGSLYVITRKNDLLLKDGLLAASKHIAPENTRFLEKLAESDEPEEVGKRLMELEGFYSGVIASDKRLILFRDHVGHMPLAYKLEDGKLLCALERVPIGSGSQQLQPGSMLIIENGDKRARRWYSPQPKPLENEDPWKVLAEKLLEMAEKYLPREFELAFSGGLDSSILAYLGVLAGKKARAIAVGVERCLDRRWAGEAAELLGIELREIIVEEAELLEAVELLKKALPEYSKMDLAIGSIFHLAARNCGGVLVSGQGADELFGGYWKYEDALKRKGIEYAAKLIREDIENIHRVNLERDELAIALAGSDLLAPYLSRQIYELALAIDPSLKIRSIGGQVVRKWVLRMAARELGLPEKLINRPKKAAQYSSGIMNRLRRLLKAS